MYGQAKRDVHEILMTLCEYKKVEILSGAVCKDHVHLCVSIPPKFSVSDFVGYLKGKSALMLFDRHPDMESKFNRSFWARGYYVTTVGDASEEAVRAYIDQQTVASYQEDRTTK